MFNFGTLASNQEGRGGLTATTILKAAVFIILSIICMYFTSPLVDTGYVIKSMNKWRIYWV